MNNQKLLIHSIKQVVQVVADDKLVVPGHRMKKIAVLEDEGKTFSVVVGT